MQDLVTRMVENLGIDASIAEKAIGIILNMLKQNGAEDKVGPILAAMPGAEELIANADDTGESSGGGLMSAVGGIIGGGIMETVGQLQGLGLDIPQSQSVGKELIEYAREIAGADTVNDALKDIPGIDMVL